jgi:hypothetical protein
MTTTETTRRINLYRVSPEIYEAMVLVSLPGDSVLG